MNENNQVPSILNLVEDLLNGLQQRNIAYCHWKSNIDLGRSLMGENDLDILVDRRHVRQLYLLLFDLDFKRTNPSPQRQFPGIEDFYGFDRLSGKLIHLHIHYQLVLGEVFVKSIHIPLEQDMLKNSIQTGSVHISAPEYELLTFVFRMVLRISWPDVLRKQPISKKSKKELAYLKERINFDKFYEILNHYSIPRALFDELLVSLEDDTTVWRLLWLQHKLRIILEPFERMGRFTRLKQFVYRWLLVDIYLLTRKTVPKKQPITGGFSVALVGSDGSGKSTLVRELQAWLGKIYNVRIFHLGKPPQSLFSFVILRVIGLLNRVLALFSKSVAEDTVANVQPGYTKQLLYLLQSLCIAQDRYRAYCAIRKTVGQGGIALIDRYPLPELRQMESSIMAKYSIDIHPGLRYLANRIDEVYKTILPPDLILVLKLSPELAVQRKPSDDPEYVRRRANEVLNVLRPGANRVIVDAENPLDQVVQEAKAQIWLIL